AHIVHTGIITAIGNDTAACTAALHSGVSGIGHSVNLATRWRDELPVGAVQADNAELAELTGVPAHWPRTALLSAVAVQEAWQPFSDLAGTLRAGFFSANTVGGMDLTESFYARFMKYRDLTGLNAVCHHECGAVTELVARHFGIGGFVTTISTACSSSANSIMMAAQMIRAG